MTFISKKHLSRRTFLRGTGVTLALPLLESMVPAGTALAQTAAAPRTRMSSIYIPHGVTMDKWTPVGEGTSFQFSEILQPLEAFRDRVLVVSDLAHQAVAPWSGEDTGGALDGSPTRRHSAAGAMCTHGHISCSDTRR